MRFHKVFKLMTFCWMNVRDASWHTSFFSNRFPWGINVWIFSFLFSTLKIISSCQLELTCFAWFLSSFNQLSIAYRLTKIMVFSFFFFHLSWILQYFARLDESSKCILFDFLLWNTVHETSFTPPTPTPPPPHPLKIRNWKFFLKF